VTRFRSQLAGYERLRLRQYRRVRLRASSSRLRVRGVNWLLEVTRFDRGSPVADLAAGTGRLARAFVDERLAVIAAFHHMDARRALNEIHRTVVRSGYLALFWNVYDGTTALARELDRIVNQYLEPGGPGPISRRWQKQIDSDSRFQALGSRSFDHPHRLRPDDLASLLLTSSDMGSLAPEMRRLLGKQVEPSTTMS
jgi:hypothetical protein